MEKKKIKIWKIIFIVLVITLITFITFFARKIIIFSKLDKKLTEYENSKNIYSKKTYIDNGEVIEQYMKDGVKKTITTQQNIKGEEVKIIEVIKENRRTLYSEEINNKNLIITSEKIEDEQEENSIIDDTEILSFIRNKILASFAIRIRDIELEGKKCYELSINSDDLKIQEYIEKDTGLPVKSLKTINGNSQMRKTEAIYEYQFNVVTDKDMEMPEWN